MKADICGQRPDPISTSSLKSGGRNVMDQELKTGSRYAIGVFADGKALGEAYGELVENGFTDADLCLMAPGGVVSACLGTGS
ncbi:MAG TPA: hypothetical protein VKA19_14560, partial [Alphaproteobacteria bacterium]|nr:hypothetical protein [Alphaproteobacteria bacterium]